MSKFSGREKLRRRLNALPGAMQKRMRAEFARAADDIVAEMKRNAPVADGDLREGIMWEWAGKRLSGGTAVTDMTIRIFVGGKAKSYAHLVEFGAAPHTAGGLYEGAHHPGAPAQPYFFPSYRMRKKAIIRNIKTGLKQAVKATGR